ncbi:MAG: division/cell wall cluster transcriptional repressor MraZ [Alphaproteobacteria bacterium]|nr:division/cell wall cluster transcriptional repressor MraZ [Alphaproteobacteria bacterium]
MSIFMSTYVNKVDKKGRVSVPASFRTNLAAQSFQGVVLYRSFVTPGAIEGCGMDFMERLSARTDELDTFSQEQDELTTLIFADSRPLAWDGEGRIVLPEDLIEHAGITESVAFVGKGRTFQLQEPSALKAIHDQIRQRAMQSRPTLPPRRQTGVE